MTLKLTPEQLLELAARAPMGDLCILRHPERPDGLHDTGRMAVQWALDLVAAVNEAMPSSACADECAANGGSGCRFGPHGPNGEQQCEWCGTEASTEFPEPVYPWAEHPDAQWMAADSNGLVWRYSEEPSMGPDCWNPTGDSGDARMELVRTGAGSGPCPHWRETKRRRPEGV